MQHLPHCNNNEETRCFDATVLEAQSHVLSKPCIKIEYRTDGGTSYPGLLKNNRAMFTLRISTKALDVQEEYMIYDLISMIGAIGGTMGICVGFSFNDFMDVLARYLEKGIICFRKNYPKRTDKHTEVEPITSDYNLKKIVDEYLLTLKVDDRLSAIENQLDQNNSIH